MGEAKGLKKANAVGAKQKFEKDFMAKVVAAKTTVQQNSQKTMFLTPQNTTSLFLPKE